MTLISKTQATDAWIAPDGKCYPCYLHRHYAQDINFGGNFHFAGALAILEELHPNEKPDYGVWGPSEAHVKMMELGYLRVDIEMLSHNSNELTREQIATLELMLTLPDTRDGFCREDAIRTLDEIKNPPSYELNEADFRGRAKDDNGA